MRVNTKTPRWTNTVFEHVRNTNPIPNTETTGRGLKISIRNKSFVLDEVMFVMNLQPTNSTAWKFWLFTTGSKFAIRELRLNFK